MSPPPPSDADGDREVATAEFPDLAASEPAEQARGELDLLADVPLEVTVELGRVRLTVHDLLALQPGSVVELDRVAGAPVDVLVNGSRIARGEVVVIDEELGVRLTEILSHTALGTVSR